VLPRSRSRVSVAISLALSRWCSPDRGLVEDVQHAHQARPDLSCQPDPLGLATRQRLAGPIERQVVETDIEQEAQAGRDLLEDLAGDGHLALGQLLRQTRDKVAGSRDRQGGDLPDVSTVDRYRQDLGLSRLPSHVGHGRATM